jgi:hypothetical protein
MSLRSSVFGRGDSRTALQHARAVTRRAGAAVGKPEIHGLEPRALMSGDGFIRTDLGADLGSNGVVVADFDRDGLMDVATSNGTAGNISILLNSPTGFKPAVNYNAGTTPTGLSLIDINSDTYPDLVTFDAAGPAMVGLTNTGNGTFQFHDSIELPAGVTAVTAAHLNRDDSMEIIAAFAAEDKVAVYRIVDTGNQQNPTGIELNAEYAVGDSPSSITVDDVNRDGAPDILTTNAGDATVSIILNTPTQVTGDAFVQHLFKDLLRRAATEQEVLEAGQLLAQGQDGRQLLARNLLESPEFISQQVRSIFTRFMWRDPSQQEMNGFMQLLDDDGSIEDVKVLLLSSDEYFESRASQDIVKFINLVYADLLGRPVDPQTIGNWKTRFDAGLARVDMVRDLAANGQYVENNLRWIFDRFLRRMPNEHEFREIFGELGGGQNTGGGGDNSGENNNTGGSGQNGQPNGPDLVELTARLLASPIYFKGTGGGTGSFSDAVNLAVGNTPTSIQVNEVNGDGMPDLIVTNSGSDTVSLLYNNKQTGQFTTGTVVHTGDQPVYSFGFHEPGFGFTLITVNKGEDTIAGYDIAKDGKVNIIDVIKVGDQPTWAAPGRFTHDRDGLAIANSADGTVTIITFTDDDGQGDANNNGGNNTNDGFDDIPIPGTPDLSDLSDTGESRTDNITRLNNTAGRFLVFLVPDVQRGSFVNIFVDGIFLGNTFVRGDDGTAVVRTDGFTVLNDGEHKVTASLTVNGREGKQSAPLTIKVKTPRVEVNNQDPAVPVNEDGEKSRARVDEFGRPIVTVIDRDGQKEDFNLGEIFQDLPPIQGDLVVMDETKQGTQGPAANHRRYAAGQSDDGLILFANNDDGSWEERNLTEDVPGAEPFASDDLDVMTTPWGNTNIFGMNADGELVAYWQDGSEGTEGFNWGFVNFGEHLQQFGQQQPDWEGDIEAYVVPWGGMNVVSVDASGDVTAVWWAPGVNSWIYSNLSDITGAEKLVGTVSVSVTPWGGVNILGTNALGHTIALWWAPGIEWQVTNMTLLLGAPDYAAGSASAFSSIAGDIVVAGLTEDGNLAIFQWAVSNQTWQVTNITPPSDVTSPLVGQMTGYADSDSNLFVLGSNIDGAVVQFAYDAANSEWDLSIV